MIGLAVAGAGIVMPPAVALRAMAGELSGTAQQTVPFENGTPVAPSGFEPQPIPAEPY